MAEELVIRRTCAAQSEHRRRMVEDASYREARVHAESMVATGQSIGVSRIGDGVLQIPVVVHVVWNTDAENISEEQIQSQIDVLNQDFRRHNLDVANTPPVWLGITADARIEFVLASLDPEGNPTTGITRTPTSLSVFDTDANNIKFATLGGKDAWPSDRYLNLWVAPGITNPLSQSILGYASFPGEDPAMDGVVIWHKAFGTLGTATSPYNLGRTTTHEIGHWLDLYHIWGDDGEGCTGSDDVADTPNQAGPNYGGAEISYPHVTCNNAPDGDMFMNYMDYVDDAFMYMFTVGQVVRMHATLSTVRVGIGTVENQSESRFVSFQIV